MTHPTTDYDSLFSQLCPPVAPTIQPEPTIRQFGTYTEYGIAMDSWIEKSLRCEHKYNDALEKFNTAKEKILTGFYADLEKVYGISEKLGDDIWPVLDNLILDDYKRLGSLNETFSYVVKYATLIKACFPKQKSEIKVRTSDINRHSSEWVVSEDVAKTISLLLRHFDC